MTARARRVILYALLAFRRAKTAPNRGCGARPGPIPGVGTRRPGARSEVQDPSDRCDGEQAFLLGTLDHGSFLFFSSSHFRGNRDPWLGTDIRLAFSSAAVPGDIGRPG